jgi:hypothetical protein
MNCVDLDEPEPIPEPRMDIFTISNPNLNLHDVDYITKDQTREFLGICDEN